MLVFRLGVFLEEIIVDRILLALRRSSDIVKIFDILTTKHSVILKVLLATLPALSNLSLPRWVKFHLG